MTEFTQHTLFTLLETTGIFVAAISGAIAAIEQRLDVFGVTVVAFITALGGGILRDICIGAVPPVGISNVNYLLTSLSATVFVVFASHWLKRLDYPVLFFDSIGLGLFAVSGANKAYLYTHNVEVAILMGMLTAIGGGLLRDIILNRIPVVLQKEIYALPALLGAAIEIGGEQLGLLSPWVSWLGALSCVALRLLGLKYRWQAWVPGK